MIHLLFCLEITNHPLILIPGSFGSRLAVSSISEKNATKCSKSLSFFPFWISYKMLLPSNLRCFFHWLTLDYDDDKKEIVDQPNIDIVPFDFGGIEGVRGVGGKIFGKIIRPYYEPIIQELIKHNFSIGETIFGAPYDWRLGVLQRDNFYDNLTNLVEHSYKLTGKKVNFLTHSFGANVLHHYLVYHTSPEWRQKYINCVVFAAPSFSGSGKSIVVYYRRSLPSIFKHIHIKQLDEMLGNFPILFSHFPNHIIFENETVFISPEGENITAPKVIDFLKKVNKINSKQLKIAHDHIIYTSHFHEALDVPVRIIYNSGIPTPFGLKLNDLNGDGEVIYNDGDGTIMSKGIDMVCEKWKLNGTDIQCRNYNTSDIRGKHQSFISRKESIDTLLEWLADTRNMNNKEEEL